MLKKQHIECQIREIRSPTTGDLLTKYSYLSLEALCHKYLENASIRSKLDAEKANKRPFTGVYADQMDGWASAQLKGALKIEISIDDAQLSPANGFGSSAQKYALVYASCADIPFARRCKHNDIELLMMIRRDKLALMDNPMVTIFAKLRAEFEKLAHVGIDKEGQNYKVYLSSIIGDNLGVHEILGLGKSFSNSSWHCRFCGLPGKATKKKKKLYSSGLLSCQTVNSLVPRLLDSGDVQTNAQKLKYGIKRQFPFDGITPHYTITNLNPPDILHDTGKFF